MQRLIDAGEITEEEAEHSERRNIILQALGPEPSVRTEITHQQIRKGDALVLCSDGLSGLVRPDEIARIVTEERDLKVACKRLIDRANHNGGPDNITVVIARFDGDALSSAAAGDAVGHQVFGNPGDATPTIPMEPFRRRTGTPAANSGIISGERAAISRMSVAEMAAARKQRRSLVILLVIAALAAAAWVFRDRLTFGP
jgi:protein phosphatase